ncbi:glycerol kinase GlpK [Erysipelotrichaceae bacterium OttesenSCG-928-M19]|nr:glycerol kinase GlpK [Erysipelotrichaceae bacterium OttesenSCG-928-M19]
MEKYILAIDQGTSSTRAIVFNKEGHVKAMAQQELTNYFPHPGWVEQDAVEIWLSTLAVLSQLFIKESIKPEQIKAIGITNQRETTVIWDKNTGIPVYNAIVWQSRQSSDICEFLIENNYQEIFQNKTGLPIDAYFSATKIKWLFDNVTGVKEKANNGDLLFGTIDTWLLWNLSKNKVHFTDYTNASRTMIYNIYDLKWDQELLDILEIPTSILPKVKDSSQIYDYTNPAHFFGLEIPIAGMAGDQQAALFGQACFEAGSMKNTYGTGCFMLMNTAHKPVKSKNGLITTIAWGLDNKITYALEGSIFVAGSAVQWLRDSLKIIDTAAQSETDAQKVADNGGVYLVPAFVGLGSPYWDMDAKAAIFGLTRGSTKHHITRATLEAIAYQTKDIIEIMCQEANLELKTLKVDGGATANSLLMQFQADILDTDIVLPTNSETTALGAAYLAGLACNYYDSLADIKNNWQINKEYHSKMTKPIREKYYRNWKKAIEATKLFKEE